MRQLHKMHWNVKSFKIPIFFLIAAWVTFDVLKSGKLFRMSDNLTISICFILLVF